MSKRNKKEEQQPVDVGMQLDNVEIEAVKLSKTKADSGSKPLVKVTITADYTPAVEQYLLSLAGSTRPQAAFDADGEPAIGVSSMTLGVAMTDCVLTVYDLIHGMGTVKRQETGLVLRGDLDSIRITETKGALRLAAVLSAGSTRTGREIVGWYFSGPELWRGSVDIVPNQRSLTEAEESERTTQFNLMWNSPPAGEAVQQ